jgi:hypothetical protein
VDGEMSKPKPRSIARLLALTTVSYNVLHHVWGPVQLRDIKRIVNKAMFESYGFPFGVK